MVHGLELGAFTAMAWIQSLFWELKSYKPHGAAKKKRKKNGIIGNYVQYPMINHNGKEYEKDYNIYIYVYESLAEMNIAL